MFTRLAQIMSMWMDYDEHESCMPLYAQNSLFIELPDVILCNMADTMLLRDALAVCATCGSLKRVLKDICQLRFTTQMQNVVRHFPYHVIASVPMTIWLDIEWTDFRNEWMGDTDYIDRVSHKDFHGHPFKCCRDDYGRLVLLMRRKADVAVLFQRYTDDTMTWTFASNTLPIGGCRLNNSMVARLSLWLAYDYADF